MSNARPGPSARGGSSAASVIGTDLTITGNLESKGEVQIEGEVQGDVHAQRIVIGEQAHITGALIAEEVVVRGNVQGSIRGNSVTFQSSSRIEGDVFHKSLAIEQGAFFEASPAVGRPMSVQRPPTACRRLWPDAHDFHDARERGLTPPFRRAMFLPDLVEHQRVATARLRK
jgi:cytoskeletal protein CcmA (bactofilin family)